MVQVRIFDTFQFLSSFLKILLLIVFRVITKLYFVIRTCAYFAISVTSIIFFFWLYFYLVLFIRATAADANNKKHK